MFWAWIYMLLVQIFDLAKLLNLVFQNPYAVNILLAGYDKDIGPSLYYIDYIASLHKIEKGAFGYGSYFSLAMMDRHYHSGMTVEEAVDLVDKCIMEIRSRLVVAPPNFVIKIVDKDGAREYAWRESIKDTTGAPTSWDLASLAKDTFFISLFFFDIWWTWDCLLNHHYFPWYILMF